MNNNILVSTSYAIQQYSWDGDSLVLEGTYLNFADIAPISGVLLIAVLILEGTQGRARMHWRNSKLYVAFSDPPEIFEFNATSQNATLNGQFVGQPGKDQWILKDFAFLNDTNLVIAGEAFWYTGYLLCYNVLSQTWSTFAESNYTQESLVGTPEVLF